LRAAVQAADNTGGTDQINLPAGDYKLTIASTGANDPSTGDLDIDNSASVTITGAGSGSTTVDANQIDRAFAVQSGAALSLSGMTIENGAPSGNSTQPTFGGAIYSDGALAITGDVTFAHDALAGNGGAIFADADPGSTLSVTGASFVDDLAASGGAVYLNLPSSATATISSSTFTGNAAAASAGRSPGSPEA
jgi:predicted outer membrane repeat protein